MQGGQPYRAFHFSKDSLDRLTKNGEKKVFEETYQDGNVRNEFDEDEFAPAVNFIKHFYLLFKGRLH